MKIKKIIFIIVLVVVYILVVNTFAVISYERSTQEHTTKQDGASVVIGVGEAVSIEVTRPRWYGTIKEFNGNAFVYLFNLMRVPLHTKNVNYVWIHVSFLVILVVVILVKGEKSKSHAPKPE